MVRTLRRAPFPQSRIPASIEHSMKLLCVFLPPRISFALSARSSFLFPVPRPPYVLSPTQSSYQLSSRAQVQNQSAGNRRPCRRFSVCARQAGRKQVSTLYETEGSLSGGTGPINSTCLDGSVAIERSGALQRKPLQIQISP